MKHFFDYCIFFVLLKFCQHVILPLWKVFLFMEKLVKDFNEKYMRKLPANIRMLDITSEVGELAKEVIKCQDYGETEFKTSPDLKMELGDCLYSLISFAFECDIDPADALSEAIEKYQKRFTKKGHIGSN